VCGGRDESQCARPRIGLPRGGHVLGGAGGRGGVRHKCEMALHARMARAWQIDASWEPRLRTQYSIHALLGDRRAHADEVRAVQAVEHLSSDQ